MSPTATSSSAAGAKSGRTARARAMNSCTASLSAWGSRYRLRPASGSGGTRTVCSPYRRNGIRLVASNRNPGMAAIIRDSSCVSSSRCSRLSSDQQQLPVAQRLDQVSLGRLGRRRHQAQRPRDRRREQGRIADRGQVDEGHPVGEITGQIPGHLRGQPGLPGAAGAGQGDQPRRRHRRRHLGPFAFPAHQRGGRGGQRRRPQPGPRGGGLGRRRSGGLAGGRAGRGPAGGLGREGVRWHTPSGRAERAPRPGWPAPPIRPAWSRCRSRPERSAPRGRCR